MPQEVSNKEPGKSLLSTFKDEWLNVKKPDEDWLWSWKHPPGINWELEWSS
jgi:hypothetical protein